MSLAFFFSALACNEESISCADSPSEVFERRIQPLIDQGAQSSCAQCHFGGVDLSNLLRNDACESMACLKQAGLVDTEDPEASVILAWINRAEPQSGLITEEVIAQEHAAFLSWIEHEASCSRCATVRCDSEPAQFCREGVEDAGGYTMESDPGDCQRITLERLFRGTIYEERGRCAPCHFREEQQATELAPRWLTQRGECQVASLWSLGQVEARGYINARAPEQSLLLLKPLAEFQGGVAHGGHDKIVKDGDTGYDQYLHFLQRYAACSEN